VHWIILICMVGMNFFQQASDAIVLYSPLVFRKADMSSNKAVLGATVNVDVIKMCFVLVATPLLGPPQSAAAPPR
jgi:hypothetical protein